MSTTDDSHYVLQPDRAGLPNLFDGPVVLTPYQPGGQLRPAAAARVATLERQAPQLVARAKQAGVEIQFLGRSPLLADHRLYRGPVSDWVFGPGDEHEEIVVPLPQRRALKRLIDAGINFPFTFWAHEVDKQLTAGLEIVPTGSPATLTRPEASALVGPVPPPAGAVELGDRLGARSSQILHGVGQALPIVGVILLGVAAVPLVLAAGAVGAIASLAVVDPIIFGAIPALGDEPGEPALWYQLVAWEW